MKNLIQKYFMAIVAVMMVVGFSAFKVAEYSKNINRIDDPITIYFHGDPMEDDQVKDPERWKVIPNAEVCDTGENKACSMEVDEDDLSGTGIGRYLDGSKILLDAIDTNNGFIPEKIGGSSSTEPEIYNRL